MQQTQPQQKNRVKELIKSKVSLAPMAGITDYVLRSLVRKYSPDALLTTEMISSEFLAQNIETEITKLDENHHPIVYQICGHKPHLMKYSAQYLTQFADMIDINIKAVHTLTKLFLKDFKEKDSGYILNVASSAAFLSGPLMSTYYATKGYVLKLTEAIYEELRREDSNVYIGALCPGPVDTEFNKVAGVQFNIPSLTSHEVAEYAINQMFRKKLIIIPGWKMKFVVLSKFIPRKLLLRLNYNIQKKKEG